MKSNLYKFRIELVESISEDMFEFDVYEMFDENMTNLECISVILMAELNGQEDSAILDEIYSVLGNTCDDMTGLKEMVSTVRSSEDYLQLVQEINEATALEPGDVINISMSGASLDIVYE